MHMRTAGGRPFDGDLAACSRRTQVLTKLLRKTVTGRLQTGYVEFASSCERLIIASAYRE